MKEFIADDATAKRYKRKSLGAFIVFFVMIGAAWAGWKWLVNQPLDNGIRGGIQTPLRKVLDLNEEVYSGLYSTKHLIKEYPRSAAAKKARVNGEVGLKVDTFDPATWKLQIVKATGDTLFITLDDIKKLNKIDVVFNFKCIEGWSQITWWSGVRFSEVLKHYGLEKESQMKFV